MLAACVRPKETAEPQPVAVDEPQREDPTGMAVPMRLTEEGRERATESVIAAADPRDTAFEAQRLTAVAFVANDFEMGRLGRSTTSARDRAVLAASEGLFSALFAGELPVDSLGPSLGPGGRAILEDLIWQARDLGEPRFGLVEPLTNDEVVVPYRILGSLKVAAGELVLEKVDDQWYIADIQVEVSDRDTTSRFDPGAVRSGGR